MATADLIRTARLHAGLTQVELARRAGTSQSAVARYEAGAASPSVTTLERLLGAAGHRLELHSTPGAPNTDRSSARLRHLRAHRREILAQARALGARDVRIFGSVARGEDTASSDIDLLVTLDDPTRGLLALTELAQRLSDLLDEKVDVWSAGLVKPEVSAAAEREAIPL